MLKSLLPALFAALPAAASADLDGKEVMPCVDEICLGDGMAELERVSWNRAKNPKSFPSPHDVLERPVTDLDLQSLRKAFRGSVARAGPYLHGGAFDEKGLELLKGEGE